MHRDAPRVVGREGVVDVHRDVVALQTEVGVRRHPVDQAGRHDHPLDLGGVVVEVQLELGDVGLRIGARVLVDAAQHVSGGAVRRSGGGRAVHPGGEGRAWVDRGGVAVGGRSGRGTGCEGDRPRQRGHGGQAGRRQLRGDAVERAAPVGHQRLAEVGGGVAVDLVDAERGLVGEERGELPGGEGSRRVGDDDAVVVAGGSRRERGQGHGLCAVGPGGVHLGVGHALFAERRRPRRRGRIGRPVPDEQDLEIQGHRRRGRGRARADSSDTRQAAHGQATGHEGLAPPRQLVHDAPVRSDRKRDRRARLVGTSSPVRGNARGGMTSPNPLIFCDVVARLSAKTLRNPTNSGTAPLVNSLFRRQSQSSDRSLVPRVFRDGVALGFRQSPHVRSDQTVGHAQAPGTMPKRGNTHCGKIRAFTCRSSDNSFTAVRIKRAIRGALGPYPLSSWTIPSGPERTGACCVHRCRCRPGPPSLG